MIWSQENRKPESGGNAFGPSVFSFRVVGRAPSPRSRVYQAASKAGFTLVELLVVIAIMGILAAFLLPALSKAKGQVRRIQCVSQQRQLMLTWNLYSVDANDALVANGSGAAEFEQGIRTWVGGDTHFSGAAYTNSAYLVDSRYAAFADYIQTERIYKCPEDRSVFERRASVRTLSATGDPVEPDRAVGRPHQIRSYAMNAYVGRTGDAIELTEGYRTFKRSTDFASSSPSRFFVFQDVNPASICFPAFMVYMPGDEVDGFYHYPSSLHNGAGVISFADGHTETHRWEDVRTREPFAPGKILPHWNPSVGNPDVAWLQSRTTESVVE